MEWISVKDELPSIGQRVILFANGVVQNELYVLDAHDPSDFHIEYFWAREDTGDDWKISDDHFWMRMPAPPETQKRSKEA